MNNSFFNSVEIIKLFNRWKKQLLAVFVISLLASVIFSSPYFIKPKYKSEAIVYPSNLIAYSDESATEQMLQLAQSADIRDKLIATFDLVKHYGLDSSQKMYRSRVIQEYNENVKIRQTEYESMEISVLDEDPVFASRLADSLIHFFDVKARSLQSEKSREVMIISKNQLDQKQHEMDSMENILRTYRLENGIIDYRYQSREALRAYLKNLGTSNSKALNESKAMMDALKDKGGEFLSLNEHLWRTRGSYNDLKLVYENAYRDVYKKLTYANVVTSPKPSDKKAYPIRWLIVVITVGSSMLLAFIILLLFDSKKQFKT